MASAQALEEYDMLKGTVLALMLALIFGGSSIPASMVIAHTANCATAPAPHTYGLAGSVGGEIETVGSPSAGIVTVNEGNTGDCDGDGIPADFDGDYEFGIGGGFFGAGPWANEPICQYGLKTHGTSVTVTDLISANAAFVTGADDQSGPIVIPDPVNGGNICETDGNISPGDPSSDPTADSDDCLSVVFINSGTACGTGGDGGFWVFLECEWVLWPPPPHWECSLTTGFITA